MSKNNMELTIDKYGDLRLMYWDSEHGDDRIFVLSKAHIPASEEIYCDEKDEPELKEVDLFAELEHMTKKWEASRKEIKSE